jgi:hypothetical protein
VLDAEGGILCTNPPEERARKGYQELATSMRQACAGLVASPYLSDNYLRRYGDPYLMHLNSVKWPILGCRATLRALSRV